MDKGIVPPGLHSQKVEVVQVDPFLLAHLVACRSSCSTPRQGKAVLGAEPGSSVEHAGRRNSHTAFKLLLVQRVVHHGKVFDAEVQKDVR